MHIKKQYADDCELRIGMPWQQFKVMMASAWSNALKKRRMMIDLGCDVDGSQSPSMTPADPSGSVTPPAPAAVASFTAGADDVLIDIQCKEEGCGVFKYSTQKIQWLRDKFADRFKMPSRCAKHKAIADAARNGTPSPENPVPVPVSVPVPPPISPPPANRFGSRRTPNAGSGI